MRAAPAATVEIAARNSWIINWWMNWRRSPAILCRLAALQRLLSRRWTHEAAAEGCHPGAFTGDRYQRPVRRPMLRDGFFFGVFRRGARKTQHTRRNLHRASASCSISKSSFLAFGQRCLKQPGDALFPIVPPLLVSGLRDNDAKNPYYLP